MSTFSKVQNFLYRHRNKFLVTGLTVGGIVLITRYAQRKLRQCMEKEAQEFLNRSRKQQHFESIIRTGSQTIKSLSLVLNEAIAEAVNTDEIIEALSTKPKDKLQYWNQLKIRVFTKLASVIYLTTMLVVTLRLQLSIIGGYLYNNTNSPEISLQLQEKYLSHCQNLLKGGVTKLSKIIETACQQVLEPVSLNKELKLSDLEALFWAIQTLVEEDTDSPIRHVKHYVLQENVYESDNAYNNIMQDTVDFLESDEMQSVITHCVSRGFTLLTDIISEYYDDSVQSKETLNAHNGFTNPYSTNSKPLAKLLPILNGLFTQKSIPTKFVDVLLTNEKILNFGANVFESLM